MSSMLQKLCLGVTACLMSVAVIAADYPAEMHGK